jgi:hypothetical protein
MAPRQEITMKTWQELTEEDLDFAADVIRAGAAFYKETEPDAVTTISILENAASQLPTIEEKRP